MLAWIGGILVICACGGIGRQFRRSLQRRREELLAFLFALQCIEIEIRYAGNPLPLALAAAGKQAGGQVGEFFMATGQRLAAAKGQVIADIWRQTLEAWEATLALNQEDLELLHQFGLGLGVSGVEDQMKRIGLTVQQLNKRINQAEENLAKMGKVWTSLGWGTGLVVVLLWI